MDIVFEAPSLVRILRSVAQQRGLLCKQSAAQLAEIPWEKRQDIVQDVKKQRFYPSQP
jgi:hypothetical protein